MAEKTHDPVLRRYSAKVAAALLILPLLLSCASKGPDHAGSQTHISGTTPTLIPFPAHLAVQSGQFVVSDGTPLVFDKTDAESVHIAAYFADLVHRTRGLT